MRTRRTMTVVAAFLALLLVAGPASAATERTDVDEFGYLNCGTGNPRFAVTVDGWSLAKPNGGEVWHFSYAFLNVGGGDNSPATGETFTLRFNGPRPDETLWYFTWPVVNEACGY